MKILGIIQSFFELTFRVVLAPRAKVLFYYPQHFNRSTEGTNPFFDAMLETCRRHGISYKLIEEPDWGTDKPRNGGAIKGDWLFIVIVLVRKVLNLHKNLSYSERECRVARIVDVFTFGKMRYDKYVIISGSLELVLPNINPGSIVFDMQHGVQYSNHSGWFEPNGKLKECYQTPFLHWFFWGDGYKDCFLSDKSNGLQNRVHTVGYPLFKTLYGTSRPVYSSDRKDILVSMQFTNDSTQSKLELIKKVIDFFLDSIRKCNVHVLLKHHPRYNNVIDINDLLDKYSFAELSTEPLSKLKTHVFMQVTLNSTTAFEFAGYGIPSYFLASDEAHLKSNIFYKEYNYPLYFLESVSDVVDRLRIRENWVIDSAIVFEWFKHFYSPFDDSTFLDLINTANGN